MSQTPEYFPPPQAEPVDLTKPVAEPAAEMVTEPAPRRCCPPC